MDQQGPFWWIQSEISPDMIGKYGNSRISTKIIKMNISENLES